MPNDLTLDEQQDVAAARQRKHKARGSEQRGGRAWSFVVSP